MFIQHKWKKTRATDKNILRFIDKNLSSRAEQSRVELERVAGDICICNSVYVNMVGFIIADGSFLQLETMTITSTK